MPMPNLGSITATMPASANAHRAATTAADAAQRRPVTPDEIAQVAERLADELEALTAAYEKLRRENQELASKVDTDALTGVASRAAWEAALVTEERHRSRSGSPMSVVIVDLDGLKAVNDEIGHRVGDELLRRCGELLARSVRSTDLVARIGGDEFGILLRYTGFERAAAWCARLEEELRALDDPLLHLSIGWAPVPRNGAVPDAVHLADRRMYKMKRLARAERQASSTA